MGTDDDPPDPVELPRPEPRPVGLTGWWVHGRDRLADWAADRSVTATRVGWWAVAGLAVAALGWWALAPRAAPVEVDLPQETTTSIGAPTSGSGGTAGGTTTVAGGSTTSSVATEVVVHAAGAVVRPGLYHLPVGARVADVITAAGGLRVDADPDRLNLAAPVADGERVYVLRRGELAVPPAAPVDAPPAGGGSPGEGSGAGGGPDTPVDLNTADADALDALPGVGPATAAAIIAYRDEHGPFASVDDLLEVRGIGEAKLDALRDLVTL